MRFILLITLVLSSSAVFSQKIRFKIDGQQDTTVNLVRYHGAKLYYADTAEIKKGIVEFNGAKHKPGVFVLFLPGQKMLEFIYNNEEIYIETSLNNLIGSSVIKKSEENKLFLGFVKFIGSERQKANGLVEQRKEFEIGSTQYETITANIDETTKNVTDYQNNIIKNNPNKLVSKIVKMSMDVEIPDAPRDEAGNMIDSNFKFNYYRAHYFDNIDFTDDRLVRTPVFANKLENYFSKNMMIQHWDTVLYYAFKLCDQFDPKSEVYQYTVSWITSSYEQSKIMGMDKVFVMMGERYYCALDETGKPKAHWMPADKLATLCEKVETQKRLVMGAPAPNIILRDTTDVNWVNLYNVDAEYTVLYFWDPECGHCKTITPKLQTLYEKKFKERNVEIFAVGKAIDKDFEKWKAFIRKHNMQFINVAVTNALYKAALEDARMFVPKYTTIESLNYQQTYDIFSTPKVFILDKDKKIIAKSLTISQLEDMLDRLQGVKNAEKLFPPEKEVEDEQMH
jgi:thiol-disulfide isomerase/thioredoxin